MPIYEFRHPGTGEVIEVVQKMLECHVYVGEDGTEWERVWNNPNAAIDSALDPFSAKDFVKHTAKKGMSAGDMMDLSKDLSNKREKARGLDPIKNKTVTDYEKKTRKPHPNKNK